MFPLSSNSVHLSAYIVTAGHKNKYHLPLSPLLFVVILANLLSPLTKALLAKAGALTGLVVRTQGAENVSLFCS